MTSSLGAVGVVTAAATRQMEQDRTVAALARILRNQREQGAAAVALIEQASPDGKGRLLNAWA
jgi:hypothetical protein